MCRLCLTLQEPPEADACVSCTSQRDVAARAKRHELLPEKCVQAGLPPRYRSIDVMIDPALLPYATNGRGLFLNGPAGVGKTVTVCRLAVASYQRWADLGGTDPGWKFLSFPAFVMELQDAWRKEATEDTALALLKKAAAVSHLILDDLGAEKLTEFVRQAVYYLLNEREQWVRPTVITSNFSLAQLDTQFDSRISSRIAGMCDVKAMKGADRRLVKKA